MKNQIFNGALLDVASSTSTYASAECKAVVGFSAPVGSAFAGSAAARTAAGFSTANLPASAAHAPANIYAAAGAAETAVARQWSTNAAAPQARHRRARVASVIEGRYREKSR